METLRSIIPEVDTLLDLAPEELGYVLLKLARNKLQNGRFNPDSISQETIGVGMAAHQQSSYDAPQRQREINVALSEAWNWLKVNSLIVSDADINGHNGYMVLSRRGEKINSEKDFQSYKEAIAFPKALLHHSIADKVWLSLVRGDFAIAVFTSFLAVEEAVRKAGNFDSKDIGTDLMRRAFDKENGPLTDTTQPLAEREALSHLFAGAIGSYKNPHSHRTVELTDAREAQEMVMLASHLLRIVEARHKI